MANYQGILHCETCSYEMDVYSDGFSDANVTLEHRSKKEHYLVLRPISEVIEEAAYFADLSADLKQML